MGKKFVVSALSVMVALTAFVSGVFMEISANALPVDENADVYAVVGNRKIPLSSGDANAVKKMLKSYDKGQSGKCPFDFNIGFEIGNYRYAIAMDGCNTVDVYSLDGKYICGGGRYYENEYVAKYFYKYFDNENIREYFSDTYED
ncbi:MAG: hypothetical protein NC253_04080 [Ruminococcus sp.]|nr:hypothetical protein [Ruminococcus sp.]MCM1380950.1 hypothetical protein [Muribaculaceae bacterium]MCM1480163.1 hypothetical protein [Muribaculaceae bacterium]